MADSVIGGSASHLVAQEGFLDLAGSYLNVADVSTLKSGALGFMIGSMSKAAADGAYHRNVLYRENFLNTAALPASIYNFSKLYDYAIQLAIPSTCRMVLGLYRDDLEAAIGGQVGEFRIPQTQQVFMGEIPFIIAGEIVLTLREQNQVSSVYDTSRLNFPLTSSGNVVRTYVLPETGRDGTIRQVVYLEVRVHQTETIQRDFNVVTSDPAETSIFPVPIPEGNQLAGFTVWYSKQGEAMRQIPQYFNETQKPADQEYCYFTFDGDGGLEIRFSPVPGEFRPAYNSRLTCRAFVTTGLQGNFQFRGVPTVSFTDSSRRGMTVLAQLITQPTGGQDRQSLIDVKRGIMSKILTRQSIINEADLSGFLTRVVATERVNGSFVTFVKRVDDVIKRLFRAFLLVRDNTNRVVPTNTIPLQIDATRLEAQGFTIKPGSLVIYDRGARIYRLAEVEDNAFGKIDDVNSFVYSVPFLMAFRLSPFPRMVYYRMDADQSIEVDTLPGDVVSSDSFVVDSIALQRNAVFEPRYTVSIPVSATISNDALAAGVVMRVVVLNSDGTRLGYAEALPVQGSNVFRAVLNTGDEFDTESRLKITGNSLYDPDTDEVMPVAAIPEDCSLEVELYYDTGGAGPEGDRFVERGGRFFQLIHVFRTAEDPKFYQTLERFAFSDMSIGTTGVFSVDSVPVIGASFFLNVAKGQEILNIVGAYHTALADSFDLLHNNTLIDVKFYNTYGPSALLTSERTNLSLEFSIQAKSGAAADLPARVATYTESFVAASNTNDRSRFSISNLISGLEANFPEIAFIRFVSLNGTSEQNVQTLKLSSVLEADNKRVPEFLNVTKLRGDSSLPDLYTPDVTVRLI